MILEKIISGGQTGVDRTALEVAEELGIPTGGWVPAGCRTDAGPAPELVTRFHCTEHPSSDWAPRTRCNVLDSDATVWFGSKSAGYWCTRNAIRAQQWKENPGISELADWLLEYSITALNVAGNRMRMNPAASTMARMHLRGAIGLLWDRGILLRPHWIPKS